MSELRFTEDHEWLRDSPCTVHIVRAQQNL